jgi:hypothetical protein
MLSYETKCVVLVLLLYIPGLIITALTGTITSFISVGWGFFFSNVLIGVVVWLLIGFLRKVEEKIVQVSQIIAPPKREKWQDGSEEWADWEKESIVIKNGLVQGAHICGTILMRSQWQLPVFLYVSS